MKLQRTKHGLKALSASAKTNHKRYVFTHPDVELLERFPAPGTDLDIEMSTEEFTTLCPVTGQPDSAKLSISYRPGRWCVESKSLKLYLMAFRQHGSFHEACVEKILQDLRTLLEPEAISVFGEFAARGGIRFKVAKVWTNNA